jgi:hypothetical protein
MSLGCKKNLPLGPLSQEALKIILIINIFLDSVASQIIFKFGE